MCSTEGFLSVLAACCTAWLEDAKTWPLPSRPLLSRGWRRALSLVYWHISIAEHSVRHAGGALGFCWISVSKRLSLWVVKVEPWSVNNKWELKTSAMQWCVLLPLEKPVGKNLGLLGSLFLPTMVFLKIFQELWVQGASWLLYDL